MNRYAIEHLPRSGATYRVSPLTHEEARQWLKAGETVSLVRTTELIGAIRDGLGVSLEQADAAMALQPGDEAVLISLSFSVLLAWAEGGIVPMEEDWRCALLAVEESRDAATRLSAAKSLDLTTGVAE